MYKGTNASSGIGIGTAVIVEEAELVIKREAVLDTEAEAKRFQEALEQTMKDTEALAADLATRVGEKEAEIMQGHLMLLMDPMLTGEIENTIKNESICSDYYDRNFMFRRIIFFYRKRDRKICVSQETCRSGSLFCKIMQKNRCT